MFNLDIPAEVEGVPSEILDPKNTWIDKDEYDLSAKKLPKCLLKTLRNLKVCLKKLLMQDQKFLNIIFFLIYPTIPNNITIPEMIINLFFWNVQEF